MEKLSAEKAIQGADHCLTKCEFRYMFTERIEGNKQIIQKLINDPANNNTDELNFFRGALAQLEDVLNLPEMVLKMANLKGLLAHKKGAVIQKAAARKKSIQT
jgi:hypothetical protein